MKKYKLTDKHLDMKHGASRLERDGYTRREIIDFMYKATPGCTTQQRNDLVNKLYNREER